ncbi:MAG: putative baseplate assembly protein [Chloroflexia bacterium]|nr:putative baseplate assembly protein [Chloroflexia bacterium]
MTTPTRAYACTDERRRAALSRHPVLMGIDFLEVSASQHELTVFFVPAATDESKTVVPPGVGVENVMISGGVRITTVHVTNVAVGDRPNTLVITVDDDENPANGVGDFSPYRLRLVDVADLDPLFAQVEFSLKVECPSDFDCALVAVCPPEVWPEPEIDYLAKDYASLRRLMLDRLSVLLPDWQERNPAGLHVALVEMLAYVGDHLSYEQDAVATEAYLGTARRRVSVRRHTRLVDYAMHDGCNARVWAQVRTEADGVELPKGTAMLTRVDGFPTRLPEGSSELDRARTLVPEVFETMHAVILFVAHGELRFYTWGNRECCLPLGTTSATLAGRLPNLHAGDVLLFEEVRGPRTGVPKDADPIHRHAVRLLQVVPGEDPLGGQFVTPAHADTVPVTEIAWAAEDALPFPLCISTRGDDAEFEDVSVARGNIVLADHGRSIAEEFADAVADGTATERVAGPNRPAGYAPAPRYARFRPKLREAPLTHAAPYGDPASASAAMRWSMRDALPVVTLFRAESSARWLPRRDLLNSGPADENFVAEVENDGVAHIRFGDDRFGLRPAVGSRFTAAYRVGNGTRGNIGAEALGHVVTNEAAVRGIRNVMPASGGTEPESIEHARQSAPSAFRTQERAVTPDDYARIAERHPEVQRAAATIRWTGSWRTVFLTVDRLGGVPVDPVFEEQMRDFLEPFRMAGFDLEIDGPRSVSLAIEMTVCVGPNYFRGDVRSALLDLFSNRLLPDGRRGVFHPDNFTFGQPVYLSRLYAAAQAVAGVVSVRITRFERQGSPSDQALADGVLALERLEVARLDNDPNYAERGIFRLTLNGGK